MKIGDYIVYLKDVCQITEIKPNYMNNLDYYTLVPVNDKSLKLNIPIKEKQNLIRNLIKLEEIENVIEEIPNIDILEADDKLIENEYKNLLSNPIPENLIKIIKTSYLRNKKRYDNKKKISDKDKHYFELAEKYLYTEFSIVLNKSFEETREYVKEKVETLLGEK